jgi:hypothetical protein
MRAEQIGRFEIAMNDANGVAFRECLAGLKDELDGIADRKLCVRTLKQQPFQVRPLQVLHHHVRHAA